MINAADKEIQGAEGEENKEDDDGDRGKKRGRKGKRTGTCVTIEKDPRVLDVADFEMEFRTDPLFKKTAAAFDEGGVAGLLLNNITVR